MISTTPPVGSTQGFTQESAHGSGRRTSRLHLLWLIGPAMVTIALLFGGGLLLGLLQALGHQPSQSFDQLTLVHILGVLQDPDFLQSLTITLYISLTSTAIAAALSVVLALVVCHYAAENRIINFLLQIPLTVPHLVLAVSIMLLLAPSGMASRILTGLSLTHTPSAFPLLVNDTWAVGILTVYIWKEVPFITFMLIAVVKNIGPELTEVGATLNATRLQRFLHITLPILAPSLGAASLIVFAFTFGAFEVPYLLGRSYPLSLPVWAYKNYSYVDLLMRPEGIAIGIIIAVIVTFAVIFSQMLLQFGRRRGLGS